MTMTTDQRHTLHDPEPMTGDNHTPCIHCGRPITDWKFHSEIPGACPKCGGIEFELRNHSLMWHDGDVYCTRCETRVRGWDAG